MREIFGPIVSMTVTLAAVYVPIGFTQGLTGTLFREFAFTLAGAVVISGIVAVTLSPMMSSKILKPQRGHGGFAGFVNRVFVRVENWYGRRLSGSLDFRGVTLVIVAVMLATTAFMFTKTASELAPEEDQGAFLGLVNAPKYATAEYTQKFASGFTRAGERIPEVDDTFLLVGMDGGGGGFVGFKLKEWGERNKKAAATKQDIQNLLNENSGVQAFVFAPPSLPGAGGGLPIQYVLRTIGDSSQAYEVAEEVRKRATASGRFIVVQNSVAYETPRARILVDRDRAATLGVPVSEIGITLGALVGGAPIAKFDRDNRSYDVVSQVAQEDRLNPERLGQYYVRSSSGSMVPLSALITIETGAAPASIEQFNQLNAATISALPLPTVTTAEGLQTLRSIAAEVMPAGFYEDFAGQSRLEVQEGNSMALAFALALVVIYLVLAAQFESFRDPFIIMMSVPLSLFGAIAFLNLGLATLNIYTQVGLITLVGLITKHGILMVEFANELKEKRGLSRRQAIEEAAKVRLRPILMTTAAMVLGVAPLLYASGAGAAARFSIGLVIASGMSIGTIFTLFVVPMFYTYIAKENVRTEGAGEIADPAGELTKPGPKLLAAE
jgi:multidrug efflux pump